MEDNKIIDLDQLQKNIEEATKEELNKIEATQDDPVDNIGETIPLDEIENLPRDEKGKVIIDSITLGKTPRGNETVRDDIFDAYYRILPDKVENKSHTWRTVSTGGKIKILGNDPETDRAIHKAGADKVNATKAQQKTFKQAIEEILAKPAKFKDIEELELVQGATNLDVIMAAALRQAAKGNVKAMDFLRDTIGQKPSERLEATVENLTAEDRELIENVKNRLDNS